MVLWDYFCNEEIKEPLRHRRGILSINPSLGYVQRTTENVDEEIEDEAQTYSRMSFNLGLAIHLGKSGTVN